mgnify:CR=1 FL=1
MNMSKTRIMTSTTGHKTSEALKRRPGLGWKAVGFSLAAAVAAFSTTTRDGAPVPLEVTDGLRILGVPIGSSSFCGEFIMSAMQAALSDSKKIPAGLDDLQTKLQLFKTCTVHKMTHLFASAVINSDMTQLPSNWHLWDSDMTVAFTSMVNEFLEELADQQESLPMHSELIASMSTNKGGVGLQHPRCTAILTVMLATKRCIEYATQGVWIGATMEPKPLPRSITHLFEDWQVSQAPAL